jgi:uncharacterized protein
LFSLLSIAMAPTLSAAQARRIALAAQGFGGAPPAAAGIRQLRSLVSRLNLLQLDSVNVYERSHYQPVFARLGHYDKADLDRLTFAAKSDYTEYWAHEAAIIPIDDWPLFRWRMQSYRQWYTEHPKAWIHGNEKQVEWVRAELAAKGPLAASQIEDDSRAGTTGWWDWSDTKHALEYLFRVGEVVSAGRTRFERTYALPEQKLPAEVIDREVGREDAVRALILKSARAHGVGTVRDLADYYRIKLAPAKAAIDDLVDAGELLPVSVEGWKGPAWLHRDARIPRRMETAALLSPFDPVVWERARAERMFDFHYRIEIYTPEAKRVFGYYSLPVLVDDRIVGRIDLKSDRRARVLRVQSAWREAHAPAGIEQRIVPLLEQARAWQRLDSVEFAGRGDLSASLADAWRGTTA